MLTSMKWMADMDTRKTVRFPEFLLKLIEAEAKKQNKPVSDIIIKGMDHYFTCEKESQVQAMRLILLKYHTKCLKCGSDLPPQTWAMYGKGVGAICTECFIERLGDKGIVQKFMKMKELNWTMKALQKQCEEKADLLREFSFFETLQALHDKVSQYHKLIMEYLKTGFEKPKKESEVFDQADILAKKLLAIIQEAELFMKGPPLKKKKKKKPTYAT